MNALAVKQLSKRYKGGVEALSAVDLNVPDGDFLALLGPNGAGKSTLIGIVSSLVTGSSGSVAVYGNDIRTATFAAKRCIGLVPQEFNFNVWEPVVEIVANQAGYYGIPRKEAYERAEERLQQLQLWEKRRVQARELSGGMKRRLMIARALVHAPRLLILDEPTAGVDIEIRHSMWDFLRAQNENGTTIILTTHYLEEAERLCRNLAIIDQGRIIEHAPMAQLLNQLHCEVYTLGLSTMPDSLPEVDGIALTAQGDRQLQVTVDAGAELGELFDALSSSGVRVTSVHNAGNRLEEVFMRLVDRHRNG